MADLNTMLLETARGGLQAQLDAAVTNGDTEAARKAADELSKLATATAPKAPPYGDTEIRAELDKLDWFGTDPKKSGRAVELGKTLNPKKFGTAAEFAAALVKAVEEEFKPAKTASKEGEEADEDGADDETDDDAEPQKPAAKKKTDGPSDGDTASARPRRVTGPWTKLSDAPTDVQKEINRTADKFAPKTEDGRKKFVAKALEAHYTKAQLAKGKK